MAGSGAIYNNVTFFLQEHTRKLSQLHEQASSGARVNRTSDAPSDAYQILRLRAQCQSMEIYSKNLNEVVRSLEMSHSVLQETATSTTKVQELLTQAISGTYGPEARITIAEEINSILEHILSLANTESLGRYLLGGTNTSAPPFEATRVNGLITAVEYQGNFDDLPVPVAPGVEYPGMLIGERVFWADNRQTPVFAGNTGAGPGTATSSVRGDFYLAVTHTQTNYPGGTGIAAGTGSADGDTVMGDHVLTVTVNGPTKTISLDGGPQVTFEGTEQNLLVSNSDGDIACVNVENWAGFEGDISITATGKLSVDDGATFTDLTSFTDNVAVADSRTGRVLYVNATGLCRTGTEPVSVPGTRDLFGTLVTIRDALRNVRNLPAEQQLEVLTGSLESLKEVSAVVRRNMTSLGGRLQAMDILKDNLESINSRATEQAAMLEDVDIVQIATALARTQTLYQMTLAVSSKLLTLSLLDFI
ncbi:MAG: hypothetical protein AMJ81_02490 [Phycisphaerae bacterium SM23_33]|nr:MAG: hypothetical protein AMJ81_02490 [Phycisphaerae bacterium SM23_33]